MAVRVFGLLSLFVLCVCVSVVSSCRCIQQSNYQKFCSSNIVVKATVWFDVTSSFSYNEYYAVVTMVYRAVPPAPSPAPFWIRVITPSSSAACGVSISIGDEFLFSASHLDTSIFPPYMSVNSCGWNVLASSLTDSDLYGLENWICFALHPPYRPDSTS
ncbi:uncharacterized protein [Apostichopus japonicus]|uniref:uncharacterized protein n=1 Tax=Stichopus japonicus TaxID=307972 RepID=UPI003AB76D17